MLDVRCRTPSITLYLGFIGFGFWEGGIVDHDRYTKSFKEYEWWSYTPSSDNSVGSYMWVQNKFKSWFLWLQYQHHPVTCYTASSSYNWVIGDECKVQLQSWVKVISSCPSTTLITDSWVWISENKWKAGFWVRSEQNASSVTVNLITLTTQSSNAATVNKLASWFLITTK